MVEHNVTVTSPGYAPTGSYVNGALVLTRAVGGKESIGAPSEEIRLVDSARSLTIQTGHRGPWGFFGALGGVVWALSEFIRGRADIHRFDLTLDDGRVISGEAHKDVLVKMFEETPALTK